MTDDPRAAFTEAVETGVWPDLPEDPKPHDLALDAAPGAIIRLPPVRTEHLNDAMKNVYAEMYGGTMVVNRSASLDRNFRPEPWLDLTDPVVRAALLFFALGTSLLVVLL